MGENVFVSQFLIRRHWRQDLTLNLNLYSTCLYLSSKQTVLQCWRHSPIHTLTDGGGCHASQQPTHQEQLGAWCLAQGHFTVMGIMSYAAASHQGAINFFCSVLPLGQLFSFIIDTAIIGCTGGV